MNETRKNPSPPGPYSEPGSTITPSSWRSRSPNTGLGRFLGSGHRMYIVAFGFAQGNPASLKASPAAPRRRGNSATFVGIQSQAPERELPPRHDHDAVDPVRARRY